MFLGGRQDVPLFGVKLSCWPRLGDDHVMYKAKS